MWGSLFWAQRQYLRPYLQEKKPAQMLKFMNKSCAEKRQKSEGNHLKTKI